MRTITISAAQERIINEAINGRLRLPSHLFDDIRSGITPLSDTELFPKDGPLLDIAAARFEEVKNQFSDDIESFPISEVSAKLGKLITACKRKEEPIRSQLEKICLNAIIETFNVPEYGVEISGELVPEISANTQFHIFPDNNEEVEFQDFSEMQDRDSDVEKRKVLDALIVGGATRLSEQIMKKFLGDIFELDEDLPHLYSKIMKINDYLIFSQKFEIKDNSHKQGGYVEVFLGDDVQPNRIEAHGIIFPILLIELLRGCLELWASLGLPDDLGKAKNVINQADALENDPWYTRLGPILWDRIWLGGIDYKYLPTFFANLSSLPKENFNNILREVFATTKKGEEYINNLVDKAKHDDDYSSFEYDIKQKQSEKGVIEDGYFTEEELDGTI